MHPGLSLDQAPPISVPFRFFISAPLFGILAALALCFYGPLLLQTRWLPATLAATHLLTLGVLTMIMCGALFQMLPVVAGAPVRYPLAVSMITHLTLSAGTLALVAGFLWGNSLAFSGAVLMLGVAVLVFFISAFYSLLKTPRPQPTVTGVRMAITGLIATAGFGLSLAAGYAWTDLTIHRATLTDLHLAWGFLGWMGMLVAVIAYQVVPMFQMTPEYPLWLRRTLAWILFGTLLCWSVGLISNNPVKTLLPLLGLLLATELVLFAGITLHLQYQRTRKIADVTLNFWRTGMVTLIIAALCWVVAQWWPDWGNDPRYPLCLGILFLAGFTLSVVNGMLYKIVPFLVWLHLQNRLMANIGLANTKIPHMKKVIGSEAMTKQFWLHLIALCCLLAAVFYPVWLARLAGILFLASFSWLGWNLLTAINVYRREAARLDQLAHAAKSAAAN